MLHVNFKWSDWRSCPSPGERPTGLMPWTLVEVLKRNTDKATGFVREFSWEHEGSLSDIMQYRFALYDSTATPEEEEEWERQDRHRSDGSTAVYYELPEGATELQHLISYRNMNSQIGEIFRACYRYGQASHSDQLRDAKKIAFYAQAEVDRLEKWQ